MKTNMKITDEKVRMCGVVVRPRGRLYEGQIADSDFLSSNSPVISINYRAYAPKCAFCVGINSSCGINK